MLRTGSRPRCVHKSFLHTKPCDGNSTLCMCSAPGWEPMQGPTCDFGVLRSIRLHCTVSSSTHDVNLNLRHTHAKLQVGNDDPLDAFCEDNPDADECRCGQESTCSSKAVWCCMSTSLASHVFRALGHAKPVLTLPIGLPQGVRGLSGNHIPLDQYVDGRNTSIEPSG